MQGEVYVYFCFIKCEIIFYCIVHCLYFKLNMSMLVAWWYIHEIINTMSTYIYDILYLSNNLFST